MKTPVIWRFAFSLSFVKLPFGEHGFQAPSDDRSETLPPVTRQKIPQGRSTWLSCCYEVSIDL